MGFFCKAFLGIPGVNETLKNIHQSIGFIDCGDHEVGTEVKMSPNALNLLTQTDQALPDKLSLLCGKQTCLFFFA